MKSLLVTSAILSFLSLGSAALAAPNADEWDSWEIEVESPHPAGGSVNFWWEFYSQGARAIRVYFEKVDTEECCDLVGVLDGESVEKVSYKGKVNGFWSDPVQGDRMFVRLTTDGSVDSYGFKITQMAVLR